MRNFYTDTINSGTLTTPQSRVDTLLSKKTDKLATLTGNTSLSRDENVLTGDGYVENSGNKLWEGSDLNPAEYLYMMGLAASSSQKPDKGSADARRLYLFGTKDEGNTQPNTDLEGGLTPLADYGMQRPVKPGLARGDLPNSNFRHVQGSDGKYGYESGPSGVDVTKKFMDINLQQDVATAVEGFGHSRKTALADRLIRKREDGLYDLQTPEGIQTIGKAQKDAMLNSGYTEYYTGAEGYFGDSRDFEVDKEKVAKLLEEGTQQARYKRLMEGNPRYMNYEDLVERKKLQEQQAQVGTSSKGSTVDDWMKALVQVESGGDANAISSAGAFGLTQLMPETAKKPGFGIEPMRENTPEEQMRVGTEYFVALNKKYGNVDDALRAYNWGTGNVDKWIAGGRDESKLPRETLEYVGKVRGNLSEGAGRAISAPTGETLSFEERVRRREKAEKAEEGKDWTAGNLLLGAASTVGQYIGAIPDMAVEGAGKVLGTTMQAAGDAAGVESLSKAGKWVDKNADIYTDEELRTFMNDLVGYNSTYSDNQKKKVEANLDEAFKDVDFYSPNTYKNVDIGKVWEAAKEAFDDPDTAVQSISEMVVALKSGGKKAAAKATDKAFGLDSDTAKDAITKLKDIDAMDISNKAKKAEIASVVKDLSMKDRVGLSIRQNADIWGPAMIMGGVNTNRSLDEFVQNNGGEEGSLGDAFIKYLANTAGASLDVGVFKSILSSKGGLEGYFVDLVKNNDPSVVKNLVTKAIGFTGKAGAAGLKEAPQEWTQSLIEAMTATYGVAKEDGTTVGLKESFDESRMDAVTGMLYGGVIGTEMGAATTLPSMVGSVSTVVNKASDLVGKGLDSVKGRTAVDKDLEDTSMDMGVGKAESVLNTYSSSEQYKKEATEELANTANAIYTGQIEQIRAAKESGLVTEEELVLAQSGPVGTAKVASKLYIGKLSNANQYVMNTQTELDEARNSGASEDKIRELEEDLEYNIKAVEENVNGVRMIINQLRVGGMKDAGDALSREILKTYPNTKVFGSTQEALNGMMTDAVATVVANGGTEEDVASIMGESATQNKEAVRKGAILGRAIRALDVTSVGLDAAEGKRGFNVYYNEAKKAEVVGDADRKKQATNLLNSFFAVHSNKNDLIKSVSADVQAEIEAEYVQYLTTTNSKDSSHVRNEWLSKKARELGANKATNEVPIGNSRFSSDDYRIVRGMEALSMMDRTVPKFPKVLAESIDKYNATKAAINNEVESMAVLLGDLQGVEYTPSTARNATEAAKAEVAADNTGTVNQEIAGTYRTPTNHKVTVTPIEGDPDNVNVSWLNGKGNKVTQSRKVATVKTWTKEPDSVEEYTNQGVEEVVDNAPKEEGTDLPESSTTERETKSGEAVDTKKGYRGSIRRDKEKLKENKKLLREKYKQRREIEKANRKNHWGYKIANAGGVSIETFENYAGEEYDGGAPRYGRNKPVILSSHRDRYLKADYNEKGTLDSLKEADNETFGKLDEASLGNILEQMRDSSWGIVYTDAGVQGELDYLSKEIDDIEEANAELDASIKEANEAIEKINKTSGKSSRKKTNSKTSKQEEQNTEDAQAEVDEYEIDEGIDDLDISDIDIDDSEIDIDEFDDMPFDPEFFGSENWNDFNAEEVPLKSWMTDIADTDIDSITPVSVIKELMKKGTKFSKQAEEMVKDIEDMYNKEIGSLAMSKPTLETEIDRMIEDLTNLNKGLMDKNLKLVNNESAKSAYSNVTKLIGRLKQAKVALEGCK